MWVQPRRSMPEGIVLPCLISQIILIEGSCALVRQSLGSLVDVQIVLQ